MNKGLLASVVVLSLFLAGCGSSKTINTATDASRGYKGMPEYSKQGMLQEIDNRIQELSNKLEQGEKFRFTLAEVGNLIFKGEETRRLLQTCIDSPEYTTEDVNDRAKNLRGVRDRLGDLWNGMIARFSNQLADATVKTNSRIQASLVSLDSVPDRSSWASYDPMRQKLEQQKELIKLIRDESIEKTYTEVEAYIKDSEDRLKQAVEAHAKSNFELLHFHKEAFYDKVDPMVSSLKNVLARLKVTSGNISFLLGKGVILLSRINDLQKAIEKVEFTQQQEHLKNTPLSAEEYFRVFEDLIGNALRFLKEANVKLDQGDYKSSSSLISKGMRFSIRAGYYATAFAHHYGNDAYIKDHPSEETILTGKLEDIASKWSEYLTVLPKVRSRATSLTPLKPVSLALWDLLKPIEKNLKEANVLCDQVSKAIRSYLKYLERKPAVKTSTVTAKEGSAVRVSVDGSITPYTVGDVLKEGDKIGYTYVSFGQIPSTDSGEAFNGLSGRKRRVISSSVRVLNAQNLEVGTSFTNLFPVKELEGQAKSGEFECSLGGNLTSQDGLCFRQKGASTGVLTAFITRFSFGG